LLLVGRSAFYRTVSLPTLFANKHVTSDRHDRPFCPGEAKPLGLSWAVGLLVAEWVRHECPATFDHSEKLCDSEWPGSIALETSEHSEKLCDSECPDLQFRQLALVEK
jgi:hypothetical protein